jgi:hypothetical protein
MTSYIQRAQKFSNDHGNQIADTSNRLWGNVKVLCNDNKCPVARSCLRYINSGSAHDLHIWFPRSHNSRCRNFQPSLDYLRGRKNRG